MKKIIIFCSILSPYTLLAYSIKNSPESTIPIAIAITAKPNHYPSWIANEATYTLKPGESGAWNQNEIREKLSQEFVTVWVAKTGFARWPDMPILLKIDQMPIKAALEIIAIEDGVRYMIGAHDKSTGQIYNEEGYNQALRHINEKK